MNEEELHAFYAGCALIGILSNRGIIAASAAHSAHLMAQHMVDMGKLMKQEKEKANDDK